MKLSEFYDPSADKLTKINYKDARRPVLSLKYINKLRKRKILNDIESKKEIANIRRMYGIKPEDDSNDF